MLLSRLLNHIPLKLGHVVNITEGSVATSSAVGRTSIELHENRKEDLGPPAEI
jgi:hypothetical protein